MEPTRPARGYEVCDTNLGWPGGSSRGRWAAEKRLAVLGDPFHSTLQTPHIELRYLTIAHLVMYPDSQRGPHADTRRSPSARHPGPVLLRDPRPHSGQVQGG